MASPLENVASFGFEREDLEELFLPAIETLLKINTVHTPREKVLIIDEALELGKEAYLTMADDCFEGISAQAQKKIIDYIIAKTYFKSGSPWTKGESKSSQNSFYLHLNTNVIFILMFGERSPS